MLSLKINNLVENQNSNFKVFNKDSLRGALITQSDLSLEKPLTSVLIFQIATGRRKLKVLLLFREKCFESNCLLVSRKANLASWIEENAFELLSENQC